MKFYISTLKLAYISLSTLLFSQMLLANEPIKLDSVQIQSETAVLDSSGLQVIHGNEFNTRYNNLSDFFETLSGVQVQSSGGFGDPVLVSIQGASALQTELQINGITQNSSQSGFYDLNIIPVNQIERIEIITSAHEDHISRAIGGTINIITSDDSRNFGQASLGSFNTATLSINQILSKQTQLQFTHEESKNNYSYPVPSPFFDSQNQFQKQELNNSEFRKDSLSLTQHLKTTRLNIRFMNSVKHIPDFHRNNPNNDASLSRQHGDLSLSSMDSSIPKPNQWFHKWRVLYSTTEEHYKDLLGQVGLNEDNNVYTSSSLSGKYRGEYLSKTGSSFIEINSYRETYSSQYLNDEDSFNCITPQGKCDQDASQSSININFSNNWTGNDSFLSQLYLDTVQNSTQNRNGEKKISQSEIHPGYYFGISNDAQNRKSTISLTSKVRFPTLYELFGDRGLLLNNEDLEPEHSTALEFNSNWIIEKKTNIKLKLQYRYLQDAIVPIYDSRGIGRYENTNEAELGTIDWFASHSINTFKLSLSGNYYHSNVTSQIKEFNGKSLSGIYHRVVKLSINHQKHHHSTQFQFENASDIYADRGNLNKGDDRQLVNINYQFSNQHWGTGINIKNALNRSYNDYSGRPSIGRLITFFAHINY